MTSRYWVSYQAALQNKTGPTKPGSSCFCYCYCRSCVVPGPTKLGASRVLRTATQTRLPEQLLVVCVYATL